MVGGWRTTDVPRARHRSPDPHELARRDALGGTDEVQRAELVVVAPPSPIGERLEVADWDNAVTLLNGDSFNSPYRNRSVLINGDGGYGQDEASAGKPDDFDFRYLFDWQHRFTGYGSAVSGRSCGFSTPLVPISYPVFVGKTLARGDHEA